MKLNGDVEMIKNRKAEASAEVVRSVEEIINGVKNGGDRVLKMYAKKFDGYDADSPKSGGLLVTEDEIKAARETVDADFLRILERATKNITEFHEHQKQNSWSVYKDNGVIMGQILRPFNRVALYTPGGTQALSSSLLMCAVPAKLAGVKDIFLLTPVKADGKVPNEILAAADCCGINKIYKVGGAHAIAAAAYGTESIPRADKIAGPGNIYVATAKKLVYGDVGIDMIAGPSDILVIADGNANPAYIAADLMGQAEHGELSSAVLLCTDAGLIKKVEEEIDRQIINLSRREIIEKSLSKYGAARLVSSLDEAFEISNALAPEHLEILTENPLALLPKVINAGSVFLGEHTPEPLGDYISGTNHVLPTQGAARFFSPLGVYDFIKTSAYSYYPRAALAELKDDTAKFAEAEGLDAHANAVRVRFREGL